MNIIKEYKIFGKKYANILKKNSGYRPEFYKFVLEILSLGKSKNIRKK